MAIVEYEADIVVSRSAMAFFKDILEKIFKIYYASATISLGGLKVGQHFLEQS